MAILYLKIACRSMLRSKLLPAINILGLTVSLSAGLLMVSLLNDLLSYDQFHEKADLIYRVITTRQHGQSPAREYASASLRAGMRIKETIAGIDRVAILEGGFQEDVRHEESVLPIVGFWADESFFNVFTFRLTKGNPASALKEPHSIVLTETAANKLFKGKEAMGKTVIIQGVIFQVTGIVSDPPMFSHIRFEILVSLSTKDLQERENKERAHWTNISRNYIYLLVSEFANLETLQANLNTLSNNENLNPDEPKITLALQPLKNIVLEKSLGNTIGPNVPAFVMWILGGLTMVVILCACFNYTSLSMGRSLKRGREIGIRKINGARNFQIFLQFISEAVLISMVSLILSFTIFVFLRPHIFSLNQHLNSIVTLAIGPALVFYFITLAIIVGLMSGFLPALFFMKVNMVQTLKNLPFQKSFRLLHLRKVLVLVQYTFSLVFISITVLTYSQYKHFISFDVGFKTADIINIELQENDPDILITELKKLTGIVDVCRSASIIHLDSYSKIPVKRIGFSDMEQAVDYNEIDENYLPLHGFGTLAGKNFQENSRQNTVIVNEQFLMFFHFNADAPFTSLGETVVVNGNDYEIVGVVKDFYYGGAEKLIGPYLFKYSTAGGQFVSVKVQANERALWSKLEEVWHKIDPFHQIKAMHYDDQIEQGYKDISALVKIIGFLSVLAITIACFGLLGMVTFSTETRRKEISIRKAFGAREGFLIYLLSKEFVLLLSIAILVALPIAFLAFEKIVLTHYAYHAEISGMEFVISTGIILATSLPVIITLALKTAHSNPAEVLKTE